MADINTKDIPIFINNRNRLEYLKKLIKWLIKAGHRNITIIDNDSSYPPLLEYYKSCPCNIVKLKKNMGHLALWNSGIYDEIKTPFYVYTDPDVVPVEECPDNAVEFFIDTLTRNSGIEKIGFGLKLDDLPSSSPNVRKIIKWEKQFWKTPFSDSFYDANVDTTFAVYRQEVKGGTYHYPDIRGGIKLKSLRSASPYLARHLPWYRDISEFTAEDIYYLQHSETITHWTKMQTPLSLAIRKFGARIFR
ncbi:MAG: glycosyltransferase family 2 protein [Gammaproteobacteria bacterium]|nr:glycosyltransferase family 2 protein [Gammaproteobacteria bacterium]